MLIWKLSKIFKMICKREILFKFELHVWCSGRGQREIELESCVIQSGMCVSKFILACATKLQAPFWSKHCANFEFEFE